MTTDDHWAAELASHPHTGEKVWALVYDATPGGRDNKDGSKSFSLRFPVMFLAPHIDDPEEVARRVAESLNKSGGWS